MKRLPLNALLAFAVLSGPGPALAQDRSPVERQSLLDLAFTLGESHALRQVCEGGGDQYWRSRMVRLTEVEKADQAFDAQLRDRFNTGFARARASSPVRRRQPRRPSSRPPARARPCRPSWPSRCGPGRRPDQAAPDSVADN